MLTTQTQNLLPAPPPAEMTPWASLETLRTAATLAARSRTRLPTRPVPTHRNRISEERTPLPEPSPVMPVSLATVEPTDTAHIQMADLALVCRTVLLVSRVGLELSRVVRVGRVEQVLYRRQDLRGGEMGSAKSPGYRWQERLTCLTVRAGRHDFSSLSSLWRSTNVSEVVVSKSNLGRTKVATHDRHTVAASHIDRFHQLALVKNCVR